MNTEQKRNIKQILTSIHNILGIELRRLKNINDIYTFKEKIDNALYNIEEAIDIIEE